MFSAPPLEGEAQDHIYCLATGPNVPTVPVSHHIQLPQLITSWVIPSACLFSLSLPHPSNQLPYSLYNLSICVHPQPFPGLAAAISRVTTAPFLLWSCSTQAPIHPLGVGGWGRSIDDSFILGSSLESSWDSYSLANPL